MNKKRYTLNQIYWIGSEDGKILIPFVSINHENQEYYYNLKDKTLVRPTGINIVKDVCDKYGYNGLKLYPSDRFLLNYEESGIKSIYINMLANEIFEPVYEKIDKLRKENPIAYSNPMGVYINFINHYDMGMFDIKKFYLFAKAVLNITYKEKLKHNKTKKESC